MKQRILVLAVAAMVFLPFAGIASQEVIFSTMDRFSPGDAVAADGSFQDTYMVRVEAGTTVEVVVRSDDVDTYIEAIMPNGERVTNDDYDGYHAGFLRMITTTGSLEFSVSPLFAGEEGEYRVTVTELGAAQELAPGDTIEGSLGMGSGGGSVDRYQLTGKAGQRVVIDLMSDDFDAYLRVVDGDGREFSDDDGGSDYNSRLGYTFGSDGQIQIIASSIGGSEGGAYTLSVAMSAEEMVAQYEGDLRLDDTRGYDGTIYDVYEYDGEMGRRASFLVESEDFDSVVYVSNPDGSNLGRDDDGGGGTNSRLDVTFPETGTYTIYVVSFFEGTGSYRLIIYR